MDKILVKLSNNFTKIISKENIIKYCNYNWNNGIGDRFCNKKFNYCVIYSNGKYKIYSEKEEIMNKDLIKQFLITNTIKNGIIGIFLFNYRINKNNSRYISNYIRKNIIKTNCVNCGSNTDLILDHKNDLYNNNNLNINDFQWLCNHCNLQKRIICQKEIKNNKIYSAKNIPKYKIFNFIFPWELKIFDIKDIKCKRDLYWYDPIEFNRKINIYISIININKEIKKKISLFY